MKTNIHYPQRKKQNLRGYFRDLSAREGQAVTDLVAVWPAPKINVIVEDFAAAFYACSFERSSLFIGQRTNQAVGNAVAAYVVKRLNRHLQDHRIEPCLGPGYPDQRLVPLVGADVSAFELKATSRPKKNDSRVVLTSASTKLRQSFPLPVNHLVGTVHYVRSGSRVSIQRLHLSFLEPESEVNVRFEAALTQRLLLSGSCYSAWFDCHRSGWISISRPELAQRA